MSADNRQLQLVDDGGQPLYSWLDFHYDARRLLLALRDAGLTVTQIVAIPRGGLVLGTLLSHALAVPLHVRAMPEPWDPPTTLVVDDNAITGGSLQPFLYRGMTAAVLIRHPNVDPMSTIYYARESDDVFLFPWEVEASPEPPSLADVVSHDCDATEE